MKAYQLTAWQMPPQLREVEIPEPGPGEVLLKVVAREPATQTFTLWSGPKVIIPYWGSAVELMEVLDLARAGKIRSHVERFPLDGVEDA